MSTEDLTQTNTDLVRRFLEIIFDAGDTSRAAELLGAGYSVEDDAIRAPARGPAGLQELIARYRRALPGLRLTIEAQTAIDDLVVTHWRCQSANVGKSVGVSAGPATTSHRGRRHSRVAAGRIAQERVRWETLDLIGPERLGSSESPAIARCNVRSGTVRCVEQAGIDQAGALLARAFMDDAMFRHVLPIAAQRAELMPDYCAAVVRYGYLLGEVHVTEEPYAGVTVWAPPGTGPITAAQLSATGLRSATERLPADARARLALMMEHFSVVRDRVTPRPHWYLMMVGVDPSLQRTGVGGRLIAPVLMRADAEEVPCYLETTEPRNLAFYRRHGFEVAVQDVVPDGGPIFWTMLRPPPR